MMMMLRKISNGVVARRKQVHTLIFHSSKDIIKPSSPTPSHLKTYNLSPLDQFCPSVYCPIIFFYPNNPTITSTHLQDKANVALLKKSLSQTLTQYYPFSGRLDQTFVDCNDEGIDFFEASIDAPLLESIHVYEIGYQPLDIFFPKGGIWDPHYNSLSSLVMVQLTHFSCGGIALAVSVSHKVADGCTLCNFVNHWAAMSQRISGNQQVNAVPPNILNSSSMSDIEVHEIQLDRGNNRVTKKFVFPNSIIAKLKDEIKISSKEVINPTRIEIVNSVLHGSAVRAAMANSTSNGYGSKVFLLSQLMNMRSKLANPLPQTTIGNVVLSVNVPTVDENELELSSLVARIKKEKTQHTGLTYSQINEWVLNQVQVAEAAKNIVIENNVGVFFCTSMCGYPTYTIDFGWGKPARVTVPGCDMNNTFLLLDTPGGDGIEALVTLEEQDMDTFQNDHQLLQSTL